MRASAAYCDPPGGTACEAYRALELRLLVLRSRTGIWPPHTVEGWESSTDLLWAYSLTTVWKPKIKTCELPSASKASKLLQASIYSKRWRQDLPVTRGSLHLALLTFCGQIILCCGGPSCAWQDVEQHPWSLLPKMPELPSASLQVVTTKNAYRPCQMSPAGWNPRWLKATDQT